MIGTTNELWRCKTLFLIVLGALLVWLIPQVSLAEGADGGWIKRQAEELPTDQVETYWQQLMKDYGGFFPDQKLPSFMDMLLAQDQSFSLKTGLTGLMKYMWHEVLYNGRILVTIVLLSIFSMILETLQTAFERNQVSKVAYSICYLVILVLAINSFHVAITYASNAIGGMIDFMMAMVPLLFTLLASMGGAVTVTVTHPLVVFMVHAVGTAVHTIVFPLLFFSALLHIVSSLSDKYKLTQLADLLRSISMALLGVLLTVFLGVISVKGIAGSVTDGVTLRAAKYLTGNFVPVVGKVFADATDTVISASLLVKNSIGLVGVIILLFLCAFPAIKIITLALIFNLSAAVMQPLGDSPIVTCLETIGKSMLYVFAALAAVGLMFFLAITIMLTAGNITVMMR
ncbi:stage III sporulation protein AE [Paenibacillus macerans]|uniref:Stage III sporulation protein AE n=1 Tax=Paenibacillus macerans TaxID=44252 RepID=A0A090ZHC3_PAEMA|nr:stage III sporulation protein AE [Paenibacillus macerans]KFN09595.1 stage III sporulation protein AE [Paenibacillus macerans]MBS5909332.1 stage III sporulation protein AE [Paenibacillus macerans]MEC0152903.1 stage III sporulation protein AE [Paenibacillus macerans]SUA82464.1 stage III sporulation protein AE [Paenibacillus macerans]GIP08327.1 stage III sporulation protein AE [Paenibacillus macerans]